MAAGVATLSTIAADATLYDRLERTTQRLTEGLGEVMRRRGIAHYSTSAGGMFCVFFTPQPVTDLASSQKSDRVLFAKYFAAMLDRGIYLAPSPFEANFVSTAHTAGDVERTIAAADASLEALLATA
jgi:glutamate-1-semialdehyde 2,1-aminomutase